MRAFAVALLLSVAAIASPAVAQNTPTADVAPIAFAERTLPNGLRVYAIRDTTTPNVSVQVWYDVGSKDDPKDRSGFAHMFEHLMFKGTRNLVAEQMDRLTEDVGGYNNASTSDDYTNYFEVVPANHLQRLLFAEADRMASLVVEPASFASERGVVKEELRQSTLATPYGKLFSDYYPALAYSRHPYARGTIGSIANLDAASIDDVRAFHATYYRPDNAILVVSGNFDPAQLDAWVDQYFAKIPRPAQPIPRVTVQEPPRTQAITRTVYEPNTPLPAILVSYHIPPSRDADTAALSVLEIVLSQGESSRLYESLVYRDQIAQSAETIFDRKKGIGNLAIFAIIAGGKSVATAEGTIRREVARLRDQPVSAAELAKAKNQLLTAAIRVRETAEGKGMILANAVIVDGDPRAANTRVAAIGRVTAADVQRVARKYLTDAQSATIRYLPIETKPAAVIAEPIAIAPSVVVAPLSPPAGFAIVTPASPAERVAPPAPTAPIAATLPQAVETRLANGMRLITVERHALPIVTASLVATGGAATDPADRAGASSLAADLMTKGTKTRSATQIAREIESLGGSIQSGSSRDGANVDVTVKSDQLAPALAILADVAANPAFATDEIERARAQATDGVTLSMKNPAKLAGLVAARTVFGAAPYGAPVAGTPASLKALTRADIVTSYMRTWSPAQTALLIIGDVTPGQAKTLAERDFAGWKPAPVATPAPAAPAAYPAPRVVVIDMPGAGQAGVVVARPGIARSDARYYPLALADTVLGGGFSSRLNQEIRIKRGLAYGASSGVQALRLPGIITAKTQTKNPTAPEVVKLIVEQMALLGTAPVPAAEMDTRKALQVGEFGRAIETTYGMASILGDYVEQGVPLDELRRYAGAIEGVDPKALQDAASAYLDPKAASIVVVGDTKQFIAPLRALYPDLTVVPAATALDRQ